MTVGFFSWALRTRVKPPTNPTIFPPQEPFSTHTPDGVLDLLLLPTVAAIVEGTGYIRRAIQHGVVGLYLLYTALALLALLVFVSF